MSDKYNTITFTVPEIAEDSTRVILETAAANAKTAAKNDDIVEKAITILDDAMGTLAHNNAKEAKAIFEGHSQVEVVESSFDIGGCELHVATHRDYQEDDGSTISFFTQGTLNTGVGAIITEATAGLWD